MKAEDVPEMSFEVWACFLPASWPESKKTILKIHQDTETQQN